MRNGFKFLDQAESKTSQFEIVFKSLACFSTQKVLNCYLLHKLRKFGDKSRNSLATKKLKILGGGAGEYGPLN